MRITNKIMRNNSLFNLNQNKMLEDKLTNQMTNQSKIARPSDDPVVAIRALRLRSNVTHVTQYYEKNAADADNWLTVTADALKTIDEILKNLYENAGSGANKDLTADDLDIILTQMKSLTKEFYSSGNVDYAGRYVFSGYRTDTAITFSAEDIAEMMKHSVSYKIKEELGFSNIDTFHYTDYTALSDTIPGNGIANGESYEQKITDTKLYRIRLSYDNLDAKDPDPDDPTAPPSQSKLSFTDSTPNHNSLVPGVIKDADGNVIANDVEMKEYANAEEAYKAVASGDCKGIAYIPSTGEMVFSEKYYQDNFKEGQTFEVWPSLKLS